jgi:hypothetical protein
MQWNLDAIRFLHPPDDFVGSFTNERMQERHKALQDKKILDIKTALRLAQSPVEAMEVLNPTEHITFVYNNIEKFRAVHSFEKTVLSLYYRKNTPFAPAGQQDTWHNLLGLCDRDKLLSLGSPFPKEGCVAYRGSLTNIPYGLSWTTDPREAQWILERWENKEMGGGTVYSADIHPENILIYTVDNKRQEVLLKPEDVKTIATKVITSIDP